jgi:hypothetical protein
LFIKSLFQLSGPAAGCTLMAAAIPVGIAHVVGKWMGALFSQSNQGVVLLPTLLMTLAREVQ